MQHKWALQPAPTYHDGKVDGILLDGVATSLRHVAEQVRWGALSWKAWGRSNLPHLSVAVEHCYKHADAGRFGLRDGRFTRPRVERGPRAMTTIAWGPHLLPNLHGRPRLLRRLPTPHTHIRRARITTAVDPRPPQCPWGCSRMERCQPWPHDYSGASAKSITG